jgi:hypothetical protein
MIDLPTAPAHFMDTAAPVGSLIADTGLAVEKPAEQEGYVNLGLGRDPAVWTFLNFRKSLARSGQQSKAFLAASGRMNGAKYIQDGLKALDEIHSIQNSS